jgi:phosphoglycerate kinase
MEFNYLTLDDFDLREKRVLLRLDINAPIDPTSGEILDDGRILAAKPTLDALSNSKVVILSHQSRPGRADFTSLEQHSIILQRSCSQRVKFVEDVIGPTARKAIKELRRGEILVLDNVRLCSEEIIEENPEKLAKTNLVTRLAPHFNLYVNDAFAAAHRAQASLVGFPYVLPSAAGRLMERELAALERLLVEPRHPSTYLLGGAKVEDKVPVIENILGTKKADHVLLGGMVAKIFLKADGHRFNESEEKQLIKMTDEIQKAWAILKKYRERIVMPIDFGTLENGRRVEIPVSRMHGSGDTMDIGARTAERFGRIISDSKTVVASGPMGIFEQDWYELGTKTVLESMANSDAFTVIGGGHLSGYAAILGIENRLSHVSTAGGAMLTLLAGEEMPAITALVESAKRHKKR